MSRDLNLYWLRSDLPTAKMAEHLRDPRLLEPEPVALVTTPEGGLVARLPKPDSPDPAAARRALEDVEHEELADRSRPWPARSWAAWSRATRAGAT